jgi:hypothetical protein
VIPFPFTTITGGDWQRGLVAARARRKPGAVNARLFSGPICPVCRRPGLHQEITGGTMIIHDPRVKPCWQPSSCGHVTTPAKEAA